ncbi:MAG: RNA-binding transcriptional accessory protein [Porticoccaceae bacterium]|nr:RNA-binding transcriptional accessory protein [Porticoccaceae bacterium]
MKSIFARIAEELSIAEKQVIATVELLDDGATVPFIARYRKEVTGSLDDTQLRNLSERLTYLRELEERRNSILASIDEQGKLSPELKNAIETADTKTRLEDLYLPYKPKRRTKGQIAIEAGIEPLADRLLTDPALDPDSEATAFVNADLGFADTRAVLEGARYILMERFAEHAGLLDKTRSFLNDNALLISSLMTGKEKEGEKFSDYFDHKEPLAKVPSHRALAMFRGRREGILSLKVDIDPDQDQAHPCEAMVAETFGIRDQGRPGDKWLSEVVRWTWRIKLQLHLETELLGALRERAELDAIQVFATNLKDLLLAAPAGQRATIALDPGIRTGVKVAIIDTTGKILDHGAIYPHAPRHQWDQSIDQLARWARQYAIDLVAIGNGTASRETDKLVGDLIKRHPELNLQKVMVNESGASIYSASAEAAQELPDLDVTIRGAVSIGRRLQDPLAELVKIDPKSIGVGQYQHDVSQTQLARSLDVVIEDCVNSVGVEVNTASVPLLRRVSGLNQTIAENIVALRDSRGPFKSRRELLEVPRLGAKTFEQAAGFLRIQGGDNPLDASSVHPEAYSVVESMVADTGVPVTRLLNDRSVVTKLDPARYTDERFGLPTVLDILKELEKPGRDPRPEFKTATFRDGVETLKDLEPGMLLEGTVTNVTNFGAFVDIGVHQDGLVHISALSEKFVKDPRDVVRAGDIVKVKVIEVDAARNRIGLSMRQNDEPGRPEPGAGAGQRRDRNPTAQRVSSTKTQGSRQGHASSKDKQGTMGALLQQALKGK